MGNHQPFSHQGSIVRKINDKAYLVKTLKGYTRVFNQSNLKMRYSNELDNDDDCVTEYDFTSYDNAKPIQCQNSSTPPRRYNLRSNRAHISTYKE